MHTLIRIFLIILVVFADGSNPIVIDGELVESPTKVQDDDAVQKVIE